jgi:hypothetical protein
MRDSLKQSLAATPARGFEKYLRGSIVVCNACGLAIYRLDSSISLGQGAGRSVSAFKPLTVADIETLAQREDIDAGVRAWARELTAEQRKTYVVRLVEPRAGDPMLCPLCRRSFVQVLSVERNEVLDRAYVVELLTIPPLGVEPAPLRGRRLGANRDWIHDGVKVH